MLSLLAMLALPAQSVLAANVYWDTDGVTPGAGGATPSQNWSTTDANWSTDSTGASATNVWTNTGADSATFSAGTDATGSYTVALGENISALGMTFDDGAVTLDPNGWGLTLGSGGITVNGTAGTTIINTDTTLAAAQLWQNNSAAALTLGGAVNNAGFLLSVGGTGATSVTGVVSGAGGLTKTGAGTLTLDNANTYTGVTTISGGVVSVSNLGDGGVASGIGQSTSAAANLVLDGGTLRFTGTPTSTNRLFTLTNNGGTIDSSGSGALLFNGVGAVAYSGAGNRALTLAGSDTSANNIALNIGDNGVDVVSIVKNGAGNWGLSGTNTFSGGVTVNAGTFNIGSASALGTGALTMAGGALDNTTGGSLSISNAQNWNGDFTFVGSNALVTSGAVAMNANRQVTVSAADLTVNGAISGTGFNLTKAGNGIMILGGTNTYSGTTNVNAGILRATTVGSLGGTSGLVVASGASLELSGGLTINKPLTISGQGVNFTGALASFAGSNVWSGNITLGANGARIGTSAAGASLEVSGVIDSGVNPFGVAIRTTAGADVVTLSNVNTYLGGTDVVVGTLRLSGGNNRLPTGSVLTLGNAADTLSATADLNGLNQTIGGLASLGTTMARSVTSSTAATLTINGTGTTTYAGTIDGNISLVKSGTGLQVLSGTNTYTGTTTVSGGVLRAGTANIPVASLITLNGGVLESNANITRTLGAAAGNIQLTGGASGFSANGAAISVILNNLASSQVTWGSADFDPSTLILNDTTANNTLNFQNRLDLNTASGRTVNANANTATISGVISNPLVTGTLTKGGAGTLVLSGANTYGGNVIVSGGILRAGNGAALGTTNGYTQVLAGATLDINGQNLGSEWVRIAGAGVAGTSGALVNSGGGQVNALLYLTLDDHATMGGPNRWDLRGTNALLNMNAKTLSVKGGTGGNYTSLTSAQVVNPGNIDVLSGAFNIEGATYLSGTASNKITVANGAVLDQYQNNQNHPWTVELAGGATWNQVGGGATSSWSGPVTLLAGTANFATSDAANNLIVNGVISGVGALNKTGAGLLTLNRANTYSGNTSLNNGTLVLANPTGRALYNSGPGLIIIGDGTTAASSNVQMGAANQLGDDITVRFNAPGGGTNWPYLKLMGFNTTIGNIEVVGTTNKAVIENVESETVNNDALLTINQTTNVSYDGYIRNRAGGTGTGILALTKLGGGKLTVSGANITYTGSTTIQAGTFALNGATAFASPIVFGPGSTGTLEVASATQSIPGLSTHPSFTSAIVAPLSTNAVLTVNQATSSIFGGLIQNNGATTLGITKTGNGTLTLTGANSFSGPLAVQGGAIAVTTINNESVDGTLGNSTGSVSLGNTGAITGTLRYLGGTASSNKKFTMASGGTGSFDVFGPGANLTLSGLIDGAGALSKVGAGTLTLTGANTFTGALSVRQGTLSVATVNDTSVAGPLGNSANAVVLGDTGGVVGTLQYTGATASSNKTFTMASGGIGAFDIATGATNLTLSGIIGGAGGNLGKLGSGTLTLSGANAYSGATIVANGTLALGAAGTLPAATTVTLGLGANAGVLAMNGNNQTIGGLVTLNNAAGNRVVNGSATGTNLTINHAGVNVFSGVLGGPGANENNFGLVKSGTGTLTLTNTNTYALDTQVSTGTLNLTGSVAGNVVVSDVAFISGEGTIGGALTLGAGVLGSLRVDGSTSGALTATGGITFNTGAQVIVDALPATASPTINVANYGGAGVTGAMTLANASQFRGAPSLFNDVPNSKITLTLDTRNLSWTGSGGTTWDIGTATNWSDGGAIAFFQGDLLTFADGPTNNSISLAAGSYIPGSMTFTNTVATPYTLGGTGVITGATGLTKSGNGTLTINNANTYTGDTTVSSGTLVVGNTNAIQNSTLNLTGTGAVSFAGTVTAATTGGLAGTGAITLTNTNATPAAVALTVGTNNANTTYSGALSGLGSLAKTGFGTLTLSGASTYSGTTTIASGTLKIGATNALPTGGGNVILDGGGAAAGTLDLNGFDLAVGGLSGTTNLVVGQVVNTVAGTKTFTVGANHANSSFAGTILAGTGDIALTKVGGGILTLQGSNTYTGVTTLDGTLANSRGGITLDFAASTAPTTNIINSSSALVLQNGDLVVTGRAGVANTQTFNGTTLNEGYSSITATSGVGGNAVINLGAITHNARSIINFVNTTGAVINTSSTNTNGILGGWATYNGNDFATVTPAGITAASYINDTWAAGNNTNVSVNATVAAASTTNSLRFNNNRVTTLTLAGNATLTSGGLLVGSVVGGNATTINGGTLGVGGNELDIINNSTGILTLNSAIDAGVTNLIKAGGGQVNIGSSNPTAFSSGITLTGGILQANASNALGTGTIHLVGRQVAGTRLQLSGGITLPNNVTIDSADPVAGFGPIHGIGAANQVNTVSGTVQVNIAAATGGHLSSAGGSILDLTGPINAASGVALNVRAGNVRFSNASSSYSGLAIQDGTVIVGLNDVIPTGLVVGIGTAGSSNGVIDLRGRNQTLAGVTKGGGTTATVTNTDPISPGLLPVSTLTLNTTSANTYAGTFAGALNVTKTGAATLTLSGANTNGGLFTISQGTTQVTGGGFGGGVRVSSPANLEFVNVGSNRNIAGDGVVNLTGTNVSGAGQGTFNGANNAGFTGTWNVGGGTTNGFRWTVGNLTTLATGTGTINIADKGQLYLGGGTGGVIANNINLTGNGWVEGAGVLGAVRFQTTNVLTGNMTLTGNTRFSLYGGGAPGSNIAGPISGAFGVEVATLTGTPGPLTLANPNNTFSGDLAVRTGNSVNAASLADSASSAIILGDAANAGTFTYMGSGATFANRGLTLGGSTGTANLNASGSGAIVLNGAFTNTAGAKTLNLGGLSMANNAIGGGLADNGGVLTVTKGGIGAWALNGANTYTGVTTVNAGTLVMGGSMAGAGAVNVTAGTLRLGANNALNAAGALTVNATGAGVTATLDLNGFNQTLNSLTLGGTTTTSTPFVTTGAGVLTLGGGLSYPGTNNPLGAVVTSSGSGGISLGNAVRTLTITDSTSTNIETTIYSPILGGGATGALTKAGTGVLYLANTAASDLVNTNTVTTGAGVLAVGVGVGGGSNAIGTANVALAGGTLRYSPNIYAVAGETSGFVTNFYNGTQGTLGSVDFATLTNANPIGSRTGVDTQINVGNAPANTFNIIPVVQGMNHTNIAATWNGLLNITTAGQYTFQTFTDDGAFLHIDGNPIVGSAANATTNSVAYLSAGKHAVSYRFAQGGGGVYTVARYSGPDTNNVLRDINSVGPNVITNAPVQMTVANAMNLTASTTIDIGANTTNSAALTVGTAGQTLTYTSAIGSFVYEQSGAVTLPTGTTTFTSATGTGANVLISGNIGEAAAGANLTKAGANILTLSGTNSYTGNTAVTGGVLRVNGASALPATGNLSLNGGVLELQNPSSLTLPVGTGAGQMQLAGVSGFSAFGSAATVNSSTGALTWAGTAGFNPGTLVLNYYTANKALDFQNDIDLNGATRNVGVYADPSAYLGSTWGASPAPATLSGFISGGGASLLNKVGPGVLVLAPNAASNTWNGGTTVAGGVLRIKDNNIGPFTALSTAGNTNLTGGVLELQNPTSFVLPAGTGAGQIQLSGNSGFGAFGAAATVNLGGAGASLTWGAAPFNPGTFVLNYYSSDSAIDFQNALNLNAGTRTVGVLTTAAGPAATLSGQITGTGASNLVKTGLGTLILSNATNNYAGTTTVNQGTLRVGIAGAIPTTTALTVSGSSTGMIPVFDLNGINTTVASVTLGGAFFNDSGAIATGAGVLTTNGNVTFSATNNPLGATISGTGAGGIKMGAGTVAFDIGDSTSTTLELSVGALIDANTFGFTKSGAGVMALSGTTGGISNTSGVSISGGTLIVGDTVAANNNGITDRIVNTAGVTLNNTTLSMAYAAAGTHAQSLASLNLAVGSNNTVNTTNAAAGTLNLTFTGAGATVYNRGAGAFVKLSPGTGGGAANFAFTNAPTTNVAGGILQGAVLNGNDVILAQAGTITAPTATNNAADALNGTNITANTTFPAASTTNSLRFDPMGTGSTLTLSGVNTITSGAVVAGERVGVNRSANITGGTVRSGASDLWIYNDAHMAIDSVIADSTGGATTLTKGGTGRLILTQNSTFTGLTTISNGSLQLGNYTSGGTLAGGLVNNTANAVQVFLAGSASMSGPISGTTPTLTNNAPNVANYGVLTLNNLSNPAAFVTLGGSGQYVVNGAASSNINKTGNGNLTLNGAMSGLFLLQHAGAGANLVQLGASASFTNNVTMGTAGNGTTLMQMGAVNQFDPTKAVAFNAISGQWSYLKTMGFSQNLGTMTATNVAGAVMENTEGERLVGNAVITFTNNANINYTGYFRDINNGFAGMDSGTLGMVKQGTGDFIIDPAVGTGRILYTGPTTISGGTLTVRSQPTWGSQITNNAALALDYAANTSSPAFKGVLGSGTLTKTNLASTVWIAGASTYTGATTINGGVFRANDGQGLPSGGASGNLTLAGGVWEMGANTTRAFGTGNGELQISGNSGFSAYAGDATLNFGSGTALTWGVTPGFNPATLLLNVNSASGAGTQAFSTNSITIPNNIDMGASARTIHAGGTFGATTSTLSGVLAGTAGLVKTGAGTLVLSNTANTFTGALDIREGTLSVASLADVGPGANGSANILIGNTTSSAGLRFTGPATSLIRGLTFASGTGGATIDASGAGALVLNGIINNPSGAKTLTLRGTNTAANTMGAAIGDATNGNTLSLNKTDSGKWELNQLNTYSGATNITGGTLSLAGAAGRLLGTAAMNINNGGTLLLDNTAAEFTNRVVDGLAINLGNANTGGGTLSFIGVGATATNEIVGAINLAPGYNVVSASRSDGAGTPILTLSSLGTRAAGSGVNFSATNATINLTTNPTLVNGIIGGFATFNGTEWATTSGAGPFVVGALATYETGAETAWADGDHVKRTAASTVTLTANRNVSSVNMAQTGQTIVDITAGRILNIRGAAAGATNGGILMSGNFNGRIVNGTLTSGDGTNAAELIFNTGTQSFMTVTSVIANNASSVVSLSKLGTNTLIVQGTNTYTGATTISQGILKAENASAMGTVAAGTTVLSGAQLALNGGAAITYLAEPLTLNGFGPANDGALTKITGDFASTWAGPITLASDSRINNTINSLTLDVASGNAITGANTNLTLGGANIIVINDPINLGTGGITKDGANLVQLSAANVFTGPVFINQGHLKLTAAGALGTASQVVVSNGGSISLEGAATTTYTARPVIINGQGVGTTNIAAAFRSYGTAHVWGGTIVLGSDSRIAAENSGTLTLNAPQAIVGSGRNLNLQDNQGTAQGTIDIQGQVILGTGSVTMTNGGTVYMSGVNEWSGGTTVNAGYLRIRRLEALGGSGRDATVNSGGVLAADFSNTTAGVPLWSVQSLVSRIATGSTGSFLHYGQTNNNVSSNLAEAIDLSTSGGTNVYFGLWSNGESANGNQFAGPNAIMTGALTPNGSTYRLANAQTWGVTAANFLTGARSLDVGDVNTAGGALFVTNKQNFTGGVVVNRNALIVSDLANGGLDSGIGASSNAASNLVLGGSGTAAQPGFLVYNGSQNASTDRNITMINEAVLDIQGLGSVTYTGNLVSSQTVNKPLYLRANTFPGVTGTFAGNISNAPGATTNIVKDQGLGTWILSGTNSYTGGTSVSAGVLQFNSLAATGSTVRDIFVNNGGSVALNTTGIQNFLNTRVSPNAAGTIALTTANAAENIDLSTATGANFTAAHSIGAVGDVTYTGTLTPYLPSTANTSTWRLGGGYGTLRFSQVMGDVGTNAVNNSPVIYFGAGSYGTVDLTGNAAGNTYTGITTINGAPGAVFLDQGTTGTVVVNKESLLGANPAAFAANQLTLNHGILRTTATFDIDDSNRGVTLTNAGWFNVDSGTTLGINNPIAGNGKLAKIGAGTLSLGNASTLYNSSTGDTFVYTGTLKLGANEQITNTASLRVFGTVDMNGKSETVNGLFGYGTITNSSATAANLIIGHNNATNAERFLGSIQDGAGAINLIKTGTGLMNLIGTANNFSGSVWVQNGTLQLDSIGNTGHGTGAIKLGYAATAGGLYWLGGTGTTSRAIDLAGNTATGVLDGSGNGPVSFTGGVTASGSGTKLLQLQGSYIGSYNGGAGPLGNNTVAGSVVDSAGGATTVFKTGTGLWALTGAKTYTGGTIINQGTLAIDGDSALGASSGAVIAHTNSVTLQTRANTTFTRNFNTNTAGQYLTIDTNGFDATLGDNVNNVLVAGPGKFRKMGAGTLTLSGTRGNLWMDGVDVTGGKLLVDYANLANNLLPTNVGATGGVGMAGGTLEFKANASANTTQILGTLFSGTGESDIVLNLNGNGANTATVGFQGFNARSVGSVVNFSVTGAGNGSMTTTQANNTWGIFGGHMTFNDSTFAYNNSVAIAGLLNSSYTNYLAAGQNVDVPAAGLTLATAGTTSVSTLRFDAPSGGTININSGSRLAMGDASHTGALLVTPNVTSPVAINGAGDMFGFGDTILINNSAQDLIINTTLSGDQPITKAGPGRVVLTGGTAVGKQPNTGTIYVNQGTLLVTGAGVLGSTNNAINIGYSTVTTPPAGFATPTVEIDSAAALVQATDSIRIGVNGVAAFNQSAGTVRSNQWVEITNALNSVGTYNMSGGTLVAAYTTAGGLIVGNAGQGTFNLSGGEVNVYNNGVYQLARTQGGSGVVNQSGGTVNLYGTFNTATSAYTLGTGNLTVGDAGPGTYNQSGGTVNTPSGIVRLGLLNAGTGTYNLTGGTLATTGIYVGGGSGVYYAQGNSFNLAGGTLKANTNLDVTAPTSIGGAALANSVIDTNGNNVNLWQSAAPTLTAGSLTKSGLGSLNLPNANTYAGGTTINDGKVIATGTSLGTGVVTIAAGATLSLQDNMPGLKSEYYNYGFGGQSNEYAYSSLANFESVFGDKTPNLTISTAAGGQTTVDFGTGGAAFPAPYNASGAQFTAKYSGKFNAPTTGNYLFYTASDDNSQLFVDGANVVYNNYSQGVAQRYGSVYLTAGLHDLAALYANGGGGYGFYMDVAAPGEAMKRLPNSMLSFEAGGNATVAALNSAAPTSAVTLGNRTLTISDGAGQTFAGVISGTGSLVKSGAGTQLLSGNNTYSGATSVTGGTLRVDGSVAASTGVTVSTGATFTAGATQVVKSLNLAAASSNASILAGAIRVLSVGDNTAASPLTLTGGKMDLNTSALVVDFTAGNEAANLAALKASIIAGRGTGVWDGTTGVTSSAAAASPSVYGVGYAPGTIITGPIAGVTPDASSVVARYTRLGDANLDGAVNFFDLTALAAAYGGAGDWYNGDFDYSGTINFFDLTALAANYGTGLPSEAIPAAAPDFSADLAAAFASVPEPGALSLLGLAALALLKRRNNRKAA